MVAGAPYKATGATFRLENNVVTIDRSILEGERARLELRGWIHLEGPLGLKLALGTQREGLKLQGVSADILDVLTDDEGWVLIPMEIRGTSEEPRIRPDTDALIAQAKKASLKAIEEKVADEVEEELKGIKKRLRRLLD